jgi:ureidoglycolate lyase
MTITLKFEPLTREAFQPFGGVIDAAGWPFHHINNGMVERYHDFTEIDVAEHGGRPGISIMRAFAYDLPMKVEFLERHPLSTQAFIPLDGTKFLIIVAPPGDTVRIDDLRCFVSNGHQGVNYKRGTWHHVLLPLARADFLVVDRIGEGPNCDKFFLPDDQQPWIVFDEDKFSDTGSGRAKLTNCA